MRGYPGEIDWSQAALPGLEHAAAASVGGCGCASAEGDQARGIAPGAATAPGRGTRTPWTASRPGDLAVPPCGGRVPPEVKAALPRANWWEPEFARDRTLSASALEVRARLAARRDRVVKGAATRSGVTYTLGTGASAPSGCGDAEEVVQLRWDDVKQLAGMNAINLGYSRWEPAVAWGRLVDAHEVDIAPGIPAIELATCLPDDEIDPDIDMTLVRELFFPDWERRRDASWSELIACMTVDSAVRVDGLNATGGWGMYSRGVLYALSLLDSFAELGAKPHGDKIGYSPEGFRRDLRDGTLSLYLGPAMCDESRGFAIEAYGDGRVQVQGEAHGHSAYTVFSIYLCTQYNAIHAALADYYFWWCRRLLTRAARVDDWTFGWYYVLAWCCAKAALAEIVELAALILHEYGHVTAGGGDHCQGVQGDFYCAHYLDEWNWRHRMWGKFALPTPQVLGNERRDAYASLEQNYGSDVDPSLPGALGRFDFSEDGEWELGLRIRMDADGECDRLEVTGIHCSFWREERGVRFEYVIPSAVCAPSAAALEGVVDRHWPCPSAPGGTGTVDLWLRDDGPPDPPWGGTSLPPGDELPGKPEVNT